MSEDGMSELDGALSRWNEDIIQSIREIRLFPPPREFGSNPLALAYFFPKFGTYTDFHFPRMTFPQLSRKRK